MTVGPHNTAFPAVVVTAETHAQERLPAYAAVLHADHLVQPAALGLREAGHMEGEARVV